MSCIKTVLEDRIYELAAETGYDIGFLLDQWNAVCEEAAEDGETADWDQFCGVARELDL